MTDIILFRLLPEKGRNHQEEIVKNLESWRK
jgi:hypothetical protein